MSDDKAFEVPVLATKRLRLRPLSMNDVPGVFAINSDPQTLRYWSNDVISELSQAEEIISNNMEHVASGNSYCWAIEEQLSPGLIGTCTLFKIDKQNRHAEVGYILNRDFWGRGYMSEALSEMIEYAFETLQMHRLEADTDPENLVSLALLRKFGFKTEGYFRQRWLIRGKWLDSEMLGLLKSEYPLPRRQIETSKIVSP